MLVSVMLANNEIGVVQPLADIGEICRAHCRGVTALRRDASCGPYSGQRRDAGDRLASFSAHKLYGPKGVGALVRATKVRSGPLRMSNRRRRTRRRLCSGTLNVPRDRRLRPALDLCVAEMPTETVRLAALRNRLFAGLTPALDGVTLNGPTPMASDCPAI